MLLSVIVPCYQVEKYIADCLESLAVLDASEAEILLIDDCGQDQTAAICRRFCARYPAMRLIERAANGGLSAARNTGLDYAQGDYVFFLDSDDICDAAALLHLARAAKEQRLDILKARFVSFDDATGETFSDHCCPASTPVMTGDALFAAQCRADTYEPMVWQCIYRRAFMCDHKLRMAEGFLFEDELFQTPALLCAQRVRMDETCIVRYRQRPGSIMKSFHKSADWCAHYLAICRKLFPLCAQHTAGTQMLRRRIGQIALNVGKNIAAYGLEGDVRAQAEEFLRRNKRELSCFALSSGDAFVASQGLLLRACPTLFLRLYARTR